jgi:hypothetical protein
MVGSVCKNLIDLGSYLWKERDTRKYLKITRDHGDLNAKRPNLDLLPQAFDRRQTPQSPAPLAVSGSAEAWNREGRWRGFRGDAHRWRRGAGAAGAAVGSQLGLLGAAALRWSRGHGSRRATLGSASWNTRCCSLVRESMGAPESTALWPARLCGSGGAVAAGARQGGSGELGRGAREARPRPYRGRGHGRLAVARTPRRRRRPWLW